MGAALLSVMERAAPGLTVRLPLVVAVELSARVPALTLMLPVSGSTLEKVRVPVPILVSVAVVPAMAVVLMLTLPAPAKVRALVPTVMPPTMLRLPPLAPMVEAEPSTMGTGPVPQILAPETFSKAPAELMPEPLMARASAA